MNREQMQQLSNWMGFVGIITIIAGAISAIAGVFAFVIGAIPGIIAIVLGVKLRNAKQNVDALLLETGDLEYPDSFNLMVANLNTYFKIQGILIIIGLISVILGVVFGLVAGFAAYSYM